MHDHTMPPPNNAGPKLAKKERQSNKELLLRLHYATSDLAFIGTMHPSDHRSIEREYRLARKAVKRRMKRG